ncbi:MAG: L-threonylcarbamoyladenylate synthase, partial [Desulfitobacterium hafniense]|nr:L-threonylcarbamoyladenylate synthase [Desulfitobacterium hafniense]
MNTRRLFIDVQNPDTRMLNEAAEVLRSGELVAFPTETVYGLGADALNPDACAQIFKVKGRPQDNPLIAHVVSKEMADSLVRTWTPQAEICARRFWPGPLT